jgi:hypothetical protein
MNAKKTLAMMLVLSLLVAGGVMQITAGEKDAVDDSAQVQQEMSESSEEEISSEATDSDNVEEEVEVQDADDESDASEEDKGNGTKLEDDVIDRESEGEEELED